MSHKESEGESLLKGRGAQGSTGKETPAEAVRRCLSYSEEGGGKDSGTRRGCSSHGQFCCCQCCSGCCSCEVVGEVSAGPVLVVLTSLQCQISTRPALVHAILNGPPPVRFSPPKNQLMTSTEVCWAGMRWKMGKMTLIVGRW
eukprot:768027-Hanusia_phi.AAC.6